ncbi:uncharacterized protein LOC130689898 [Daphnia carinata]|uniref:uncharacterized protein LOC130689898 n=1 Tax=Daphnia carinata TaxID=120202 RepID=UPI002580AD98|nr:uncharacterized protein LOC130689898 [Daphnia carinata]
MFSPIIRSAQRISIRNWAHSSSSLASLQVDAKCIASIKEQPSSGNSGQNLTKLARRVSSVAVESKFDASVLESHLACSKLLEDADDNAYVVQETSKIDVYHHLHNETEPIIEEKSKWQEVKKQQALKKFQAAEERLMKNDATAYKLFQAIKAPLLELERYRASALIDRNACRSLISQIGDIQDPATAIVIGNPGAGILSKELLKTGAKQLLLFECNPEIRTHLQRIHKDDPVEVSNQYLFGSHLRSQDTKHALSTLLESQSCTRVKIILSLTNPTQARDLLANYTTGLIPYDNKDVEIYLIVEKSYGDKLDALEKNDPTQKRVKFATAWRTFIKTELLCTLPANSFFPTFAPLGFGIKGRSKRDPNVAVLRCTFRSIAGFGRHLNSDERHLYNIFIRHVMTTSTAKVAHSLEKWTPGIGIRLIRQGISLFTCFNQLTKEEFERVFFTFVELAPINSPVWSMMSSHYCKSIECLKHDDVTC